MKTKLTKIQQKIHHRISRAILLCCLGIILSMQALQAQDPGFSQFFASPLTLNPALTGKFNGVVRVAGNYRNQWPSINNAFVTSTISVDAPILRNRLPDNDTWGLGIMAMNDKTAGGAMTSNYVSLSTAYHKALDEDGYHQIGVGFQGAYANRVLDGTQLHFEDQLNLLGGWDPVSPSETLISGRVISIHYFDMNLGALYNASTNGNNNYYIGASAYHLNRPKVSFLGVDTVNIPIRLTGHAGGYFPVPGSPSTIYLSGQYNSQGGAHEMTFGGAWAVSASQDESYPVNFYAGLWGRFSNITDAVIPYVGLDYGNFNLGVTYDVNVSTLKTASQSRGGIEISLIYIKKPSDGHRDIPCPRF